MFGTRGRHSLAGSLDQGSEILGRLRFDGRSVTYGLGEPDMLVPAYVRLSGDRLRTSTARCCGWPAIMLRCDGS